MGPESKSSEPPKVVIDARMVEAIPHGFSRYVTTLAQGLSELSDERELGYEPVFLVSSHFRNLPRQAIHGFATCEVGAKFLSPLELVEIPRVLRKLGAAAYHSPTFSSLLTAPCPWIQTIHDLNHLKFGSRSKRIYYERLLRPFARRASALVTVSEFSRQELAAWLGMAKERIEIVTNSVSAQEKIPAERIHEAAAEHGVRAGNYFLSLSNPKPHKNLVTLVAAFKQYRAAEAQDPSGLWDLLLSVRPGEVPGSDAPGIHCLGGVSDLSARALLAGAGAVAFPSLYEGFGLPPVEAAAQGIPVLVSRIPPHREALQDLVQGEATWIEPLDVPGWARALAQAAKGRLIPASIESRSVIFRRYSTRQAGERMDLIYRRVLGLTP